MKRYPQPTSKKHVCAFLGLVGYYRRVLPVFSLDSPISDLTKEGQPDRMCLLGGITAGYYCGVLLKVHTYLLLSRYSYLPLRSYEEGPTGQGALD